MKREGTLIIGVGNPYRGDDAVGLWVAERLERRANLPAQVCSASGEGAALLALWQGVECAIVVDAVRSGAAPGKIFRFEAQRQVVPARFFHYSTHAFSVAEAVELSRALGQLPPRLILYGIEGEGFRAGQGLSPCVRGACETVIVHILEDLGCAKEAPCTSLP